MKTQKTEDKTEQADEATVVTDSPEKPKTAFFITPLGGDNSDIRRATDGLIDAVIEPALKVFNIDLIPPHKIENPGNITRQVVKHILDSDLVIANLTGLNANVMYELAIRHAKRKPVIVIADKATSLPFDIAAERTIFYTNDMGGVVELMKRLIKTIPVALQDKNPENPVYSGLESSIIQQKVVQEGTTTEAYILAKLDQLADSISYLKNSVNNPHSSTAFTDQNSDQYFFPVEEVYNKNYPANGTLLRSMGIEALGDAQIGDMLYNKSTAKASTLHGTGTAQGTGVIILKTPTGNLFAARPDVFITPNK